MLRITRKSVEIFKMSFCDVSKIVVNSKSLITTSLFYSEFPQKLYHYAPINSCPTIPPGAVGGDGWGFDQAKVQMPHHWGRSGDQIPY